MALSLGLVLLLGAGVWVWLQQRSRTLPVQASSFSELKIPLDKLDVTGPNAAVTSLKVNGNLQVANSLALVPTSAPENPVAGQIYYDKATNRPLIYNGTQFVVLQGGGNSQVTNNAGNTFVTNNAGNTINNTTIVQGSSGNATANGTVGSIAMFTGPTTLGSSLITQAGQGLNVNTNTNPANTVAIDAGTAPAGIQIGNSATNHDIQIGTGAGVQTLTAGSGSAGSATTIQGGSGGTSLITGSAAGVTGNINIKTGDSSTTASGNINIDSGTGIIDGQIVSNKTFEGGLEQMDPWFSTTVAQSSAQAHSGTNSLAATITQSFGWGVIEQLPGIAVTPGHQYLFSFWARAGTVGRSLGATASWQGTGINTTFNSVVDSTSGWTQSTIVAQAPAGSTSVSWELQSGSGAPGEVHYFDDLTITDLSSATAFSAISIGDTNAKVVTIGNLNEIAATSILGGSGINLNAGAGSLIQTGGIVNITGHAASSFVTSAGALTLTSAATATWGISTASTGDGGNLTLKAGNAGSDASHDGGDLLLQGGTKNGTGLTGSVIVKPPTDSPDAFQIQASDSTPLLTADTSAMQISVTGTTSAFAKLTLTNAHFATTQTNPPTIGTPANCGTTPTAAVTAGSTDTAGSFTITTGTGGTSSTCDTTFTFNRPYGAAPKSIIIVGKSDTASASRQIYVASSNTTTFNASFAASAAGANSTTYSFSYWVVE